MPELAPILRELGRLEAIQHAFAELSHRTDDRRKHDMIDLRRRETEGRDPATRFAELSRLWLMGDRQLLP